MYCYVSFLERSSKFSSIAVYDQPPSKPKATVYSFPLFYFNSLVSERWVCRVHFMYLIQFTFSLEYQLYSRMVIQTVFTLLLMSGIGMPPGINLDIIVFNKMRKMSPLIYRYRNKSVAHRKVFKKWLE